MGHHDAAGGNELDKIVTIAHCIHAVLNDAVESELTCNHGPVDREGRAGQRCRSKRKFVQSFVTVRQSFKISFEH